MNRVMVHAAEMPLPEWVKPLKHFVLKVLLFLKKDKWDLSILICGDNTIKDLNTIYRGKAEATDVLSFPAGKSGDFPSGGSRRSRRHIPGDIVISIDTMRENARRFQVDEDEELRRLLIHGILHLDGMDHGSNDETEPMLRLQEQILSKLSKKKILGRNP
ncbi:MAG: rRNA maturation RNase YbeY [Treponema sp.]|jgi:probable rRNA maturation factor|nr:rRNA maturation RNase YbeY [Treponema sp.]